MKRFTKILTQEMTKMPLGAKLTQNDSNVIFEMDFNMELKQGLIQTNWKDSETNFRRK
jgi:hypothetical protein